MAAEKIPKLLNNPIGERAITAKPAISELAEPSSANPHAPPTAAKASLCEAPPSRSSLYPVSYTHLTLPTIYSV